MKKRDFISKSLFVFLSLFAVAAVFWVAGKLIFPDTQVIAQSKPVKADNKADNINPWCVYDGSDLSASSPMLAKDPTYIKGTHRAWREWVTIVNNTPSVENYVIVLPHVKQRTFEYNYTDNYLKDGIKFHKGDELTKVSACGCVQTGGEGKETWKSYVNPTGDNSDKLYHGVIQFPSTKTTFVVPKNNSQTIADFSPTVTGAIRIGGLMNWLNSGGRVIVNEESYLILGYEDDDYDDNGYWKHDDGNDNQCKGIGGVVVELTVKRNILTPLSTKKKVTTNKMLQKKQ